MNVYSYFILRHMGLRRKGMLLAFCFIVGCGFINESVRNLSQRPAGPINILLSTLSVVPAYPNNGAKWNDYVKNDGSSIYTATDTACVGNETPYAACIHGGEMRKVVLSGVTSCSGLTMTDYLGLFNWTCRVTSGVATFYSSLKSSKGLKDLLTSSPAWNTNNYVVLSGTFTGSSVAGSAWWANTVTALPDNHVLGNGVATLSAASSIYVLSTSRTTDGYNINADKIALVTLSGATLTWNNGVTLNCASTTGEVAGADDMCVIASGSQKFFWIEASIDIDGGNFGVYLASTRFAQVYETTIVNGSGATQRAHLQTVDVMSSQIRHFISKNGPSEGIWVGQGASPSNYNYFEDISMSNNDSSFSAVFAVDSGLYNILNGVNISYNNGTGLRLGAYCTGGVGAYNTAINLRISNNTDYGILVNSFGNTLVNVISNNNGNEGINFSNACGNADGSTLSNAVAAFNNGDGFVNYNYIVSVNNFVGIKNSDYGIRNEDGQSTYTNIVASDNVLKQILLGLQNAVPILVGGSVLVTDNNSCSNTSGLISLADNTCVPGGGSASANLVYQGSVLGDFIQSVTTNDLANTTDAGAGGTTFPAPASLFDWLNFDNSFRVWGKWGFNNRWTAGNGFILDFRLLLGGSKIFKNTELVSSQNSNFVAGGACPNAVHGNKAVSTFAGSGFPSYTYIYNATEIVDPTSSSYSTSGNHNGLCESNESCLYNPNFGAYQGEGELGTCTFTNGTVTGVTMWGYATNGI